MISLWEIVGIAKKKKKNHMSQNGGKSYFRLFDYEGEKRNPIN